MMCISVFLLGLLFTGVFPDPKKLNTSEAITYVQHGGLLSYDLDILRCVVPLGYTIPAYSFGDRINDVITYLNATDQNFMMGFSGTTEVNGSVYNLTDVVRLTQVSVGLTNVNVEITDLNQTDYLTTETIMCDLQNDNGVTFYGRSSPGEELTTFGALGGHLKDGYDINYVLNWDMCTPNQNATYQRWAGRLSGYRFTPNGDIAFTQVVDSAPLENYMIAVVSDLADTVQVKMYGMDRVLRNQTDVVTRSCVLGQGYRVFVAESP